MSELIAEARVLVTPDTTAFRTLLIAQVAAASKGVTVPVNVVPAQVSTGALSAATAAQLAGAKAATASAAAQRIEAQERRANTKAAAEQSRQLSQLSRGAGGAALSMAGLRGATLAATGPFLAGAAAFAVFAKSVSASASFETSLNTFRVTADATADEMERISTVARDLGTDLTLPGVTAQSAADALAQLSRAGLSVEDSIDGVRGTLQLATAAAIDNETAVLLVATALNSFRLEGTEAARVADLLAASSKESQGSIEDMGLALQQAAAAAAQAGISVEDTVAILTQLGRAGLRGSDAGTSFRTAILRIINPSKQAQKAIEGLGVELRDLNGNIRPEVFAEIATQAAKLGPAARDATIALIGGQDAFRAISILGRDGAEGLNAMRDATQEVGVAAELASARTEGLAGAFENLKNQGANLALEIGDAAKGPLTDFVNVIAGGLENINRFSAFLDKLGEDSEESGTKAERAAKQFQELVEEAGKVNLAAAFRGSDAGEGLLEEQAKLNKELEETQSAALLARDGVEEYRRVVQEAANAVEGLVNRIDESTDRFAQPLPEPTAVVPRRRRVSQLEGQAQLAESEGDLRTAERIRERILDNAIKAERAGIHKSVEARQRLFEERVQAETALNSTRKQIASEQASAAQKTASEAARRQREAEQAQREADDKFLQAQEDARVRQERQVIQAGDTDGLKNDIREQKELRALIVKQIAEIKASSVSEKAKQDAIRELRRERDTSTDEIKRLQRADKEARDAAREEFLDAREAFAQSVFDLTGNKSPLLKVIAAQLKAAIQVKNQAKKGSLEWLRAKTEINELLLQRKELLKQVEEDARSTQSLGFEFLQRQQGFAANLLGNLIPGFATAGLVGNVSTQAPITDPGLGFAAEVPTANQLNAANARGVRPVQVDTTNALLRQILAALNGRQTTPPEIQQNRNMARAAFDTAPGGP